MSKELKNVRFFHRVFRQTAERLRDEAGDSPIGKGVANNIANLILDPLINELAMAIRHDEVEQGDACPSCDGTGQDGLYGTCPNCNGVGVVYWKPEPQEGLSWSDIITSEYCIYKDICDREHHDHPIYKDENGTPRWKPDPAVQVLFDYNAVDLNAFFNNGADKNDPRVREMYRKMGYSLYGYWELFHWTANNPAADEYEE